MFCTSKFFWTSCATVKFLFRVSFHMWVNVVLLTVFYIENKPKRIYLNELSFCDLLNDSVFWMFYHRQDKGADLLLHEYLYGESSNCLIGWMFCCITHIENFFRLYECEYEKSTHLSRWMTLNNVDKKKVYHLYDFFCEHSDDLNAWKFGYSVSIGMLVRLYETAYAFLNALALESIFHTLNRKWSFLRVNSFVRIKVSQWSKTFVAIFAWKWFFPCMNSDMII